MNYKTKAEEYVRSQIPELVEEEWQWAQVGIADDREVRSLKVVGHPIQLQHWLRVLHDIDEDFWLETLSGRLDYWKDKHKVFSFNLTTGQPATEDDYQALCNIFQI